jgi:hypothetical protein
MVRIAWLTTAALLLVMPQFPPESRPATTRPASSNRVPAKKHGEFQPGVTIDWKEKCVRVDARVVLREGPIEFLACRPGKEHESILLLEGTATHIFMALGLIGLTPGKPPSWDEQARRSIPASGDLIDVTIEWQKRDGLRRANAFEFLLDAEYGRPPISRPMVFTGSVALKDGSLAADHTGAAIALVDFGDSLVSLSRGHVERTSELWVLCNTPAIPELHTSVTVVLRAAIPQVHSMTLDFRGDLYVNGRYATLADAADLIDLARRSKRDHVQAIIVEGAMRADIRRVEAALRRFAVPEAAFRFEPSRTPASAPGSAPASAPAD